MTDARRKYGSRIGNTLDGYVSNLEGPAYLSIAVGRSLVRSHYLILDLYLTRRILLPQSLPGI